MFPVWDGVGPALEYLLSRGPSQVCAELPQVFSGGVAVFQLCQTLCHPMDYGMPGSSVLYCLLAFAQIHVH